MSPANHITLLMIANVDCHLLELAPGVERADRVLVGRSDVVALGQHLA
jgi:hypothetical protein